MANINQPEPGTPEVPDDDEVTLIAEDWTTETGVVIHRQLWSDGSRRVVTDGVEEVAPILTDMEKAQPDTEETPAEEVVPIDPTVAATVLAAHQSSVDAGIPVLGESWGDQASEPAGDDDASVQQAALAPEYDGPDADEHNEARDNLEAQNDAAEHPMAKSPEGFVNNSESDDDDGFVQDVEDEAKKIWESVKDFEFKTIEELKEFARDHNINLHGATKKDDIVEAIKTEDKHEA